MKFDMVNVDAVDTSNPDDVAKLPRYMIIMFTNSKHRQKLTKVRELMDGEDVVVLQDLRVPARRVWSKEGRKEAVSGLSKGAGDGHSVSK
jgi:hypothetical protein